MRYIWIDSRSTKDPIDTDQLHCLLLVFLFSDRTSPLLKLKHLRILIGLMQSERIQPVPINQQVWKTLVPLPVGKYAIGQNDFERTSDAIGHIVRNKARDWLQQGPDKRRALITMSVYEDYNILGQPIKPAKTSTLKICLQFPTESLRTATTPYEAAKTKLKDETDPPVNVHFQENLQVSERATKLGLRYPQDSPIPLSLQYSDKSGSHGDRKSTTGGCQFLGRRLISWQCKKQTIVATSSTEAEYVAAASCCAQMPKKEQIQVLKIHTDDNVADLLTKAFDGPRFAYLVVHIGMLDRCYVGSAGFTMFQQVSIILPAGRMVSAGWSMVPYPWKFIFPCCNAWFFAGCTMICGSYLTCWTLVSTVGLWFLLVVILPAGRMVSAGCTMVLLVVIFPAGRLVSAVVQWLLQEYHFSCLPNYWFLLDSLFLLVAMGYAAGRFISADRVLVPLSTRAQLQLDDANGIFDMQIDDIIFGYGGIGSLHPKAGSCINIQVPLATSHNLFIVTETADRTPRPTFGFTRKLFSNMKLKWEGEAISLTPPMLAIAAAGNDAADRNLILPMQLLLVQLCHTPVPTLPPFFPVRETTPERQPKTEWVVPNHVSPGTDWRPWPSVLAPRPPTPPAQTLSLEEHYFGPANYIEPEDITNLNSMEDETILGGFHEETHAGPDDAPTPTADAAGRAEDPALLTSLSAKIDRCMGRIDSLETELGTSKKIMGGAILTLVSRVKKLERTVKQLRTARLVGDAPATEGDVDIQDAVDLEGLSRMASEALGHDQATVPSEDIEEREEEEVPLRRKRSVHRRARTEFYTPAFAQFHAPRSTDVLPQADISESAGPSVGADKGKAPMPDLEIPAEFLAEDAQARQRLEEEQASARLVQQLQAEDLAQADVPLVSEQRAKELDELLLRMTDTDWLTLMMQVGTNPALARELLGADVNEDNFIERMTAIKERKKRALADLRYRALKGKPLKQSEVTKMMRNLVKNQWCAAHNGTITMKAVTAMSKQQLTEEYENICRRLEKDHLLSAQYNLFRPKPAITEPPSKRQRVERASSQPSDVPAATTQPADDPDSAGGSSFHPAGSTPMSGSAVPDTAGDPLDTTGTASTVPTSAAMDSAASRHELGISPFADSDNSSSPSPVSTDHIPIDVLFDSTSGGLHEFFLASDEDAPIGMSRIAADPASEDEVLAEILFRGQYVSGAGVVVVDKLPDDEIVDPRVKVEPISESASSPPRSRSKHRGVRSDTSLWDRPVDDFLSSESESDDDIEDYIPPIPYGAFKDWEIVRCPLRNTYYHVYYQENRRHKNFFYLKELLPHVYREDLLLLRRRMNRYFRLNPDVDVGLDLWRDVNLLCQSLHSDDVEEFWRTQDDWVVSSWKLYPKSSVHVLDLTHGKTVYMFVDKVYPIRAPLLERMLHHRLIVPPSYCRDVVVAGSVIQTIQDGLRESYECLASAPIACTARQMVFNSPWLTAEKEFGSPLQTALVCNSNPLIAGRALVEDFSIRDGMPGYPKLMDITFQYSLDESAKGLTSPEQTATGKGISNPLMAVMVCLKPYGIQLTNVSSTERVNTPGSDENRLKFFDLMYILVNGAVAAKSGSCCLRDVAASFDSAVHRVHAVSFDAAVASIVSAACCAAAGYFVYCCCLLCSCCSSILLPQEDLSRNLELTESTPIVPADSLNSIPADNVPAGRSSSIPADYVSAGHVLVPADILWLEAYISKWPKTFIVVSHARGFMNTVVRIKVLKDANSFLLGNIYKSVCENDKLASIKKRIREVIDEGVLHARAPFVARTRFPLPNTMRAEIEDFLLAGMTSETNYMTEYVVTQWYRAPELLLNYSEYTATIDILKTRVVIRSNHSSKPCAEDEVLEAMQQIRVSNSVHRLVLRENFDRVSDTDLSKELYKSIARLVSSLSLCYIGLVSQVMNHLHTALVSAFCKSRKEVP
ncbi:putative ribonuclease H-like domain-containing protein [Tanacetum coccineum]